MSKERENDGVVSDVTPEREQSESTAVRNDEAASADTSTAANKPRRRRGIGFAPALAGIALVLALAATLVGYQRFSALQDQLAALERRIAATREHQGEIQQAVGQQRVLIVEQQNRLQTALAEHDQAFDAQLRALEARRQDLGQETESLQRRETELRGLIADLDERIGRSDEGWMVAEAKYLIHVAQYRLQLARDASSAQAALDLADRRLAGALDPDLAPVRAELGRVIAALESLRSADPAALVAEIEALVAEVSRLRLAHAPAQDQPSVAEAVAPADGAGGWQDLVGDLWTGVKASVRIRRTDRPVQVQLLTQHPGFLLENLKLHLETAGLALVRGEAHFYHHSLKLARRWLDDYFDAGDTATQAMQQAIARLGTVVVTPEFPDLGRVLRLLERYAAGREEARPATPDHEHPGSTR